LPHKFDPTQRLNDVKERGVGVNMPIPLHERIEQLCDLVYEDGCARPTKRKMLSAIVLATSDDAETLRQALDAFDRATVSDASVSPVNEGEVVAFPARRPGPRARR
jgi:hypothetical protein